MPRVYYDCDRGHTVCETFKRRSDAPETMPCLRCDAPAHRAERRKIKAGVLPAVYVVPDIPEHFNSTIGMPVRSRRHLQALQREHGFQDYEKDSRLKSTDWIEKANFKDEAAKRARARIHWGERDAVQH